MCVFQAKAATDSRAKLPPWAGLLREHFRAPRRGITQGYSGPFPFRGKADAGKEVIHAKNQGSAGVKFYFGAGDKSLKCRHREYDPINSLMGAAVGLDNATQQQVQLNNSFSVCPPGQVYLPVGPSGPSCY